MGESILCDYSTYSNFRTTKHPASENLTYTDRINTVYKWFFFFFFPVWYILISRLLSWLSPSFFFFCPVFYVRSDKPLFPFSLFYSLWSRHFCRRTICLIFFLTLDERPSGPPTACPLPPPRPQTHLCATGPACRGDRRVPQFKSVYYYPDSSSENNWCGINDEAKYLK